LAIENSAILEILKPDLSLGFEVKLVAWSRYYWEIHKSCRTRDDKIRKKLFLYIYAIVDSMSSKYSTSLEENIDRQH